MVYDDENENNCAEATGHDVQKAEVKCIGLSFPPRHGLRLNDNDYGFFAVVTIQPTAYRESIM